MIATENDSHTQGTENYLMSYMWWRESSVIRDLVRKKVRIWIDK